jgi:hypothetical protein
MSLCYRLFRKYGFFSWPRDVPGSNCALSMDFAFWIVVSKAQIYESVAAMRHAINLREYS